MSPRQQRALDLAQKLVPIVVGLITLFASATATVRVEVRSALGAKLDTATYSRDRALRAVHDSDEHELLLDVLCSKNVDPRNRRCPPR